MRIGLRVSPRGSQAEAYEELDGELADATAAEPSGTPIETALITLTSIVKELAGKRKAEKERTWDTVFGGPRRFSFGGRFLQQLLRIKVESGRFAGSEVLASFASRTDL